MQASHSTLAAGCLILCGLLSVGCSSQSKMTRSGYLSSYQGFTKDPEGTSALIYRKAPGALGPYDKILLENVAVLPGHSKEMKAAYSQSDLADLSNSFEQTFREVMRPDYPFVGAPGPGVLRVRCAIVDLDPGNPAAFAIGHAPYAGMGSMIHKATTGHNVGVGQVAIEAEFLDSVTGERIAAAIDKEIGGQLEIASGMTTWGHVKKAFKEWSKEFKKRMDKAHQTV